MKAYELYAAISPSLVTNMLDWFRDHDRNLYKSAIASLAQQRKLRPVFIQKKPLTEQYAWIHKMLTVKSCSTIGEHLLQAWLMAGQQEMLAAFCDAMNIEHDGKGTVNGTLPDTLDADRLNQAVDTLLNQFDPKLVTLYLTCFNLQHEGGWDALNTKLASDSRLSLS